MSARRSRSTSRPSVKPASHGHFLPLVLVVLVLIAVGMVVRSGGRRTVPAPVAVRKVSPPPFLPLLPSPSDPSFSVELSERLRFIVLNHPDPLVHATLHRLVDSGEILLNFQPTASSVAAEFRLVPRRLIVSSQYRIDVDPVPTLVIDPSVLGAITSWRSAREVMLVVYHETLHIQQWQRDPTRFRGYGETVPEAIRPTACRDMWDLELEAYLQECVLAESWGMGDYLAFCSFSADRPAFQQSLYRTYASQPVYSWCLSTFAEQVGLPVSP